MKMTQVEEAKRGEGCDFLVVWLSGEHLQVTSSSDCRRTEDSAK